VANPALLAAAHHLLAELAVWYCFFVLLFFLSASSWGAFSAFSGDQSHAATELA